MRTPAGLPVLRIVGRINSGTPVVAVVRHLDGRDWEVMRAGELPAFLVTEFESWEKRQQ